MQDELYGPVTIGATRQHLKYFTPEQESESERCRDIRAAGCSSGRGVDAIISLENMERTESSSVNGEKGMLVDLVLGGGKARGFAEEMKGGATWGSSGIIVSEDRWRWRFFSSVRPRRR